MRRYFRQNRDNKKTILEYKPHPYNASMTEQRTLSLNKGRYSWSGWFPVPMDIVRQQSCAPNYIVCQARKIAKSLGADLPCTS